MPDAHAPGHTAYVVPAGSVLDISGPVSHSSVVQFGTEYGTLKLELPSQFNGLIEGFSGESPVAGSSDVIDLVGVGTLDAHNISYSSNTGVLTITSNAGVDIANLRFSGAYTDASFILSADGAGGTNIFDPTLNPIVIENQLAGTAMSVWAINGNINNKGKDSAIEGFATNISVAPGQTENFKIHSGSTQYRIDIYRLGYYGGNGARLVSTQTVSLAKAQSQPTPLFNSTTNTVDAGNWSVSASWAVPTTATSGVYFAKLTTLNGTIGQNMIPFIVTGGSAAADITFQTNDSTWQAYNPWGGYNFYTGPDQLTSDRAYAVSYNRPIDMNSTSNEAGPQDFLFGGEFPAIYWLEENGYNVKYISSVDAATNPASLTNTKVFLDSGHDEYWSMSQYNNVKAASDAGVNLAFLSANQVYWDVAYTNGATGTANTTIVQYKDPWAGSQIDPNGTAGGGSSTFRDPVNGPGLPENSLVGNIFQVDGSALLDDVNVPYNLSQFRIWTNTSVAKLAPGGSVTLSNLLGYEWNTDNNNGFRPAGLIDLSSTTTSVGTLLLDYGLTTGSGEATHSLTLYRDAKSNALIFSAGTVMWSWGLDTQHTLYQGQTAPASPVVQQSLVNLLADMGVQPQTLLSSLMFATQTTDTTPPVSKITSIGSGAALVANQTMTISGTATDSGGGKVAMVEISTDGGTTWNRATGFSNWTYSWIVPTAGTYTIETRATNDSAYLETPSDATNVTTTAGTTNSLFTTSPGDVIKNSTASDNLNSLDPTAVELGIKFVSSRSGKILGVRFWKGSADTGSHTGSLYTAAGTLLATGNFVNETATGWQTLLFATPVAITAGTNYVAAYHSNGGYTVDSNYFTQPYSNGPLSVVMTGAGPGLFTYNASTVFPTDSSAENYWVDAIFAPGGVNQPPVANNVGGFVDPVNTVLTIAAATILSQDTDPNGLPLSIAGVSNPVNGSVSYNAGTATISFTPTTGYIGPASFTYTITDSTGLTGSANVSITVGAPLSLWTTTATPATLSEKDPNAVELGVRFTSSQAGMISGLRYYKGANDIGTHVGSLWTSSGTLLASATFTNETTSGWQTVNFATPVSISSGATYVAAYHSNGNYTDTANYFGSAYTNGPLTALSNGSGGNGVYAYGGSTVFPTSSYNATNYWVDVLYQPVPVAQPLPPVANNVGGLVGIQNLPLVIEASTLLSHDSDPNGSALSITSVSGASNGSVVYNAAAKTITFTPTAGYTGVANFNYTITDALGASASATVSTTFSAPSALTSTSVFTASDTPTIVSVNDPNAVELGMKFISPSGGTITGMQFYKGPQNTGVHTGELWSSAGALLAQATFANETASGWQSVTFANPVVIAAGETDIVSYHTNTGFYSADANYFAAAHTSANGLLSAPSSATSGGNGLYAYGGSSIFPTNTYNANNYWVDVTMKS